MDKIAQQFNNLITGVQLHFILLLKCILILTIIHVINILTQKKLNWLGIVPRHLLGVPGIIVSPLIHGNWGHLFTNSLLFLIFSTIMLVNLQVKEWINISITITLLSGAMTWLLGRQARHIGLSSTIMGYWGFIITLAFFNPNLITIIISVACAYFFSGMANNLSGTDKTISWEGHIYGCFSGLIAALLYSNNMIITFIH